MCRFIAYLGKTPVILKEILDTPENSLINQSRRARGGKFGLNADGFGIGWYNHTIDHSPGVFKSTQPAWNDENLQHIAAKIKATCFVGHVRASTVGDVNTFNCHPFTYRQFSFVHNGTIYGFDQLKRELRKLLNDDMFELIRGQTDSEHFFALLMDTLYQNQNTDTFTLEQLVDAFQLTINKVRTLQTELGIELVARINIVITDGKKMLATRYISDKNKNALSLYYAAGDYIDNKHGPGVMHSVSKNPSALLIASEPLTNYAEEWEEIPVNHMLLIDEDLTISLKAIE